MRSSFRKMLPLSFRLQNGVISFLLIAYGASAFNTLAKYILYYDRIRASCYFQVGFVPPGIIGGIRIASAVVNAFCFVLGFWMIRLKESLNKSKKNMR